VSSTRQPDDQPARTGQGPRRSPRVLVLSAFAALVVLVFVFIFLVQWLGR
jgi:hypothetical protein